MEAGEGRVWRQEPAGSGSIVIMAHYGALQGPDSEPLSCTGQVSLGAQNRGMDLKDLLSEPLLFCYKHISFICA